MTYLSPDDLKAALPRYRSHKVVAAAKILGFWRNPLRLRLDVDLRPGTADSDINVHAPEYQAIYQPKAGTLPYDDRIEAGWWLVMYDDGHLSLSPAKAFEEGYSLIFATTPESEPGAAAGASDGPAAAAAPLVPRLCNHPVGDRACDRAAGHSGQHGVWEPDRRPGDANDGQFV